MTVFGIHASHEQVHPARLLEAVVRAEEAGFTAAMCSDHFSPWSSRQGESGFAWAWLGAALQATNLPFGVVNAPGQRYHPAIIAQAISTLSAMYPGRFWAALGSGEASNEHITGEAWPRKDVRRDRLGESVEVIRALLRGETVSKEGLVRVDRAKLYTRPDRPPALIGAAVSDETVAWCAGWADGLITVGTDPADVRRKVQIYRDGGGRGPFALQVHLSYAPDDATAVAVAHDQWRSNVFAPPICWDVDHIDGFDELARHVRPEEMHGSVRISSDLSQHTAWLHEYIEAGCDALYLHHVGKEQSAFIDAFGERVLPQLDVTRELVSE